MALGSLPFMSSRESDWAKVASRFENFLSNIALTRNQFEDGETKHHGVRSCLNSAYWGAPSDLANSMLIGSWGKQTRVSPPRDIDVLFRLPDAVYYRFENRNGNKQSQLLQEVKGVLQETYPNTDMSGDGQVVMVPFGSYAVELVPAFLLREGGFWVCDTHDGGSYRKVDPIAENNWIETFDAGVNGNLRKLVRMLKRWQDHCNVPMKSFWLEMLAAEFLKTWEHRLKTSYYHDWMVRDFFQFLLRFGGGWVKLPNVPDQIPIGWLWYSRAKTAAENTQKASDLDNRGYHYLSGAEWQKVFGPDFELL